MQGLSTSLEGVWVFEPKVFGDERGFFFESFSARVFREVTGYDAAFVQDNHSRSRRGVLRGLHYQRAPHAQGKLVRVVRGEVFDVAVDIRRNSPTLGRWFGVHLSEDNRRQLWIPPGFAHGFLTLTETAEFLYKTTDFYAPASESCIAWDDPTLDIRWPEGVQPIVSSKDAQGRAFADAELM